MNNKVLVNVTVPEINKSFDVKLPINKKLGNIIILLNKAIHEMSNGKYPLSQSNTLYNVITQEYYQSDVLLINTDIRNGTLLVLIS